MKKFSYKFAMKVLLRKLNTLTVGEAQWLFRLYCNEHTEFCLRGQTGMLYAATAATIFSDWKWVKPQDFASGLPVRFEGGPAGENHQRAYYNGTLVTFLVDRIMLCHQRCGTSMAWLVRFDQESTRAIWDQLKNSIPDTMRKHSTHPETVDILTQQTLFDIDNPITEIANVSGFKIPIHENGIQGYMLPQVGDTHPHSVGYNQPTLTDGLYLWSSDSQTGVYM